MEALVQTLSRHSQSLNTLTHSDMEDEWSLTIMVDGNRVVVRVHPDQTALYLLLSTIQASASTHAISHPSEPPPHILSLTHQMSGELVDLSKRVREVCSPGCTLTAVTPHSLANPSFHPSLMQPSTPPPADSLSPSTPVLPASTTPLIEESDGTDVRGVVYELTAQCETFRIEASKFKEVPPIHPHRDV